MTLYFQDVLGEIAIDESAMATIKTAFQQLQLRTPVEQRKIKDEVNRRAINIMCQSMLLDCSDTDVWNDPLNFMYITLNPKRNQCMAHDIAGGQWLLLGI